MKKLGIFSTVAVGMVLGGYALLRPTTAECAFCNTFTCYSSSMCGGSECVCVKSGMNMQGSCASFNVTDNPNASYNADGDFWTIK